MLNRSSLKYLTRPNVSKTIFTCNGKRLVTFVFAYSLPVSRIRFRIRCNSAPTQKDFFSNNNQFTTESESLNVTVTLPSLVILVSEIFVNFDPE